MATIEEMEDRLGVIDSDGMLRDENGEKIVLGPGQSIKVRVPIIGKTRLQRLLDDMQSYWFSGWVVRVLKIDLVVSAHVGWIEDECNSLQEDRDNLLREKNVWKSETDKYAKSSDGWEDEARNFSKNADYWRGRSEDAGEVLNKILEYQNDENIKSGKYQHAHNALKHCVEMADTYLSQPEGDENA